MKASWSLWIPSGPLQLARGSMDPWDPCWTIFLRWKGCYTHLVPFTLTILQRIPRLPPIHSSWTPCSHWIGDFSSIQGIISMMQAGYPFVDSLIGFYEGFLESLDSFWATPTSARIYGPLGSLLDHLPEVKRLLHSFSSIYLNYSAENSSSSSYSLFLDSMQSLNRGQYEVE